MLLIIKRVAGFDHGTAWHLGEEFPDLEQGVRLHASGDELNLITAAMQASNGTHPTIEYAKSGGFRTKRFSKRNEGYRRRKHGLHEGD